jgi:hypothetical protein
VAEPLSGPGSGWKKKLGQKDFKNGWKCTIHQKAQKGKSDMLRTDASFQGIKAKSLMKYYCNPPPG